VRSRFAITDHEVGGAGVQRGLASIVTELTKTVRPLLQAHGRAASAARRDRRQLGPIEEQAIALPPSGYSARPDPPSNRLRMSVEHPRRISHADLPRVFLVWHGESLLQHQSETLLFTMSAQLVARVLFTSQTVRAVEGCG
jgi:hypothetical protein